MNNSTSAVIWLHAVTLLVALVGAGCASVRATNSQADNPKYRAAIEQRLQEICAAAESKDFERLDSYHAYGPKFTKYSGTSAERRDATASRKGEHEGLAALKGLTMRINELKIDVFGDAAVATFILDYSFDSGDETVSRKDRSTLVFIKQRGDWKITHEHLTPIQP
ncbi:MAG: nuclear transport factor 2 family protein [Verrucomicrobiae bacterium]|nr:nuclear transport factor 2 family protein [Verrucomicrobiae bacterium]